MPKEILIDRIVTTEGFKDLRDAWAILLETSSSNSAFLSWEWLFAWWESFGETKSLWLITVQTEGKLIGIAPLMIDKRGTGIFKLRILCNIGNSGTNLSIPSTDVGGFIVKSGEKQVVSAIFEYLIEHKREWDILELSELCQEGRELSEFDQSFGQRQFEIIKETKKHYHIPLVNDWESFFAKLTGKFRHNLRRASRLANESGKVDFGYYVGDDVNWALFENIIEVNQYSHHPRLYLFTDQQNFIRKLVELMTDQKRLIVYILSINGEPAAYEYGFIHDGRFEDWRAGYDTRINPAISIGKLLSMKVIENCIINGCTEIDFLRGDES